MKILTVVLGLALLLGKACGDGTEPNLDTPSFPIDTSFTLERLASRVNTDADLHLTFVDVTEDSRCPENTNCVWEGQAKISLLINERPVELVLRAGKPALARQSVSDGRYTIRAQSLSPYPDGNRIDPSTYQLELIVATNKP